MKNCPQCGAPIKDTAKFCMKCGCNLAQYEAAHAGGIFCPECGARPEEGALFCPEYGRKLKEALALLRREKYKEAEAVYNGLLDENPDDMNGYIGLIRVASENYTRLFGKEIDEAIRLAKKVSGKEDPDAFDEDFAAYIGRRAEETRRLAEEEEKKKAAAEAERRKEEEKRRRAEYFASRFAVEKGVLKKYKGQEARTELPEGITAIGDEAFSGCTSLGNVTFGPRVSGIGEGAFSGCIALRSAALPQNCKPERGAFPKKVTGGKRGLFGRLFS